MNNTGIPQMLNVYSTCPQSRDFNRDDYVRRVVEVARWSEEFGCTGILVYTDNGLLDPWLVSHIIVQNTESLCPLVAIQPIYMHPYTAAKMVASFAYLHKRRVCLNMLAGGFKNDLLALNDATPHDDRYTRTTEYTLIMKQLLESSRPLNFQGKYFTVNGLKMTPALPKELHPEILISGSSRAGLAASNTTGATAVLYPRPIEEELADPPPAQVRCGARIGIIARAHTEQAWRVAHERFPHDRKGELAHQLANKISDSVWHRQLSEVSCKPTSAENPYWLGPFQRYKTFCPYLVGSYERIGTEICHYIARGYRTFILDIPASREELEHTAVVFQTVRQRLEESCPPLSSSYPPDHTKSRPV